MLFGAGLFLIASYIRYFTTGSIKVDQNYMTGMPMVLNLLLVTVGLCLFGWAYYKVIFNKEDYKLSPLETRNLAILLALISAPMLPMLSNDVFSLFTWGDLAAMGINPYEDGKLLVHSSFHPYVGDKYKYLACLYGPINIFIVICAVFIGGKNILGVYAIFKIIFTLLALGFIGLIYHLYKRFPESSYNTLALVLLSPVFWCQGVGQGHTEVLGIFFLVLAMLFMTSDRVLQAFVVLALAVASKISFAYLLPLPLLYFWWRNPQKIKETALYALASGIIVLAVLALAYWPFETGGTWAPLASFKHLSASRPSGTITDVIGELASVIYPSLQGLFNWPPMEAQAVREMVWKPLVPFFKLLGILLALWTFTRIRTIRVAQDNFTLFAIIGAIMLTIFSQKFSSWYLLLIIPLFLYTDNKTWIRWLAILGLLTIAMDFMHIPERNLLIFPITVAIPAFLVAASFLWKFKERYIELEFGPPINNDNPFKINTKTKMKG